MAGKERGMLLKAIDKLVVSRMNPADYPTAGRTYLSTMQGVRSPITERNFTPDELSAMQGLITQKGGLSGAVDYEDYKRYMESQRRSQGEPADYVPPGMESMQDPVGNVQTTLGQFRYRYDPEAQRFNIQDTYDFNPPKGSIEGQYESMALSPYYIARWYGGEMVPPGEGRDVRIGLPPTKPRETTRDTLKRLVAEEAQARVQQRRK